MNLEAVRDGILGLFLFTAQWLMPAQDEAGLHLESVVPAAGNRYAVSCRMTMGWNRQLEKLVDAGIPLRFRIITVVDRGDTSGFCRTLRCNIVEYTYAFTDSFPDYIARSKRYPVVPLALKDFVRWKVRVPRDASECRIEAMILESHVSQLGRTVDMSRIWGRRKVSLVVDLREHGEDG